MKKQNGLLSLSLILLITFFATLGAKEAEFEDETINIDALEQAWTISGGGSNGRPYYSLTINGVHLEGERPWSDRWTLIKDAVDYKDKRILDIGCNMGLTLAFLHKYKHAASCTGVDRSDLLLSDFGTPHLKKAAVHIQQAFDFHFNLIQLDLNSDNYECLVGTDHDLVICFSILKWVDDKERFMNYLSHFKEVLFEGHDPDEVEIERFARHGFTNYEILGKTHIGASYPKEATRTLMHFWKE